MSEFLQFPPQQLPMSKKTKKWRKQILDWGSNRATISSSLVRKSVIHKKINYDLLNGIIHLNDMMTIINPDNIQAQFIPNKIQHYPIMNSKLNVLRGEESKRVFDLELLLPTLTLSQKLRIIRNKLYSKIYNKQLLMNHNQRKNLMLD